MRQAPQATPSAQVVGALPSAQVTSHASGFTPWHVTVHAPEHHTRQLERLLQSTWLPLPTRASQSVKLLQLTAQSSPQIAEHCCTRKHVRLQWLPQEAEQVSMSVQPSELSLPATTPQLCRLLQSG